MTATGGSAGSGRAGLLVLGLIAAIAGVVAGVLLVFVAPGSKLDDAVNSLAPAPVGCETALEFDSRGTYYVFAEVSGEVGDLGDCENDDRSYDYDGPQPDLDITMVDGDGEELRLPADDSVRYDRGGQVGQSLATVRIPEPGEYELRVGAGGDEAFTELMVRVGNDPNVGTGTLKLAGVAAFIVGAGLGILLIGLSRRGGGPKTAAPSGPSIETAPAWHVPTPPTSPPTGPPPAGPPTRPYPHQPPTMPQPGRPPAGDSPQPPGFSPPTPGTGPRPGEGAGDDERQPPPPSWGPPR